MKKYLCYDSNIGIVFYQSDSIDACEFECEKRLSDFEDYDVSDLDKRFVVYERVQALGVSWSDDNVE